MGISWEAWKETKKITFFWNSWLANCCCCTPQPVSLEGLHPRFDLLYYFPVPTCHFTKSTCLSSTSFQGSSGLDFHTKTDFCVTSQLYINRNSKVLDNWSKKFISNHCSLWNPVMWILCDELFFSFPKVLSHPQLPLPLETYFRVTLGKALNSYPVPSCKIERWYYTTVFFKWCTQSRCFPSSGLHKLVILAWES